MEEVLAQIYSIPLEKEAQFEKMDEEWHIYIRSSFDPSTYAAVSRAYTTTKCAGCTPHAGFLKLYTLYYITK